MTELETLRAQTDRELERLLRSLDGIVAEVNRITGHQPAVPYTTPRDDEE